MFLVFLSKVQENILKFQPQSSSFRCHCCSVLEQITLPTISILIEYWFFFAHPRVKHYNKQQLCPCERVNPEHMMIFTGDMGVEDESRGDNEARSLPHRERETSTGIHLQRMGMCSRFQTHKLISLHSYLGPCN